MIEICHDTHINTMCWDYLDYIYTDYTYGSSDTDQAWPEASKPMNFSIGRTCLSPLLGQTSVL